MPLTLEILTKKDCCLCDEAKIIVDRVLKNYPAALLIITDIESDDNLFEQYKERIPVLKINDEEHFVFKVHEITLQKKLDKILREEK
jgi:glutaredoxin